MSFSYSFCIRKGINMSTATMTRPEVDLARAWKDELYYESLSVEEKASLPAHPAGSFDPDSELKSSSKSPVLCIQPLSIYPTYVTVCG